MVSAPTPDEFGRLQYAAFGIRGQQGGEIISDALPQIYRPTSNTWNQLFPYQNSSPRSLARQINKSARPWRGRRIWVIKYAVMPFMEAVRQFSSAVTVFSTAAYGTTAAHPEDGATVIGGLFAAMIGGLLKGADKFKGFLGWGGLGSGLAADVAGAATGGGLVLAIAGAIKGFVDYTRDSIQDAIHGPGYSAAAEQRLQQGNPFRDGYLKPFTDMISPPAHSAELSGPRPAGTPPSPATGAQPASAPQVNMTNNIHIQGALDDGMIATLIAKITAGLSTAMAHVTADPHPSTGSIYTYQGF